MKNTVAGNCFVSDGDLKEGLNQVDNEEEMKNKMAVLSAGRCWLPRGLTFGPTNGLEDFQELLSIVFQRRHYDDWFSVCRRSFSRHRSNKVLSEGSIVWGS